MKAPLLSILIPAYDYPEGVARILHILEGQLRDDVDVVISDDSTGDSVADAVAPFLGTCPNITYQRNTPGLGACANWNNLLDAARGHYCLLMHHDDFPASPRFLEGVARELREGDWPDVLVLNCLLVSGARARKLHVPNRIRSEVVRHATRYLFARNVIGPPSVIVVRRAIYPRFDQRLQWMIDVDVYVRLLSHGSRVCFSDAVTVATSLNRSGSITESLRLSLGKVRRQELAYLREKYPNDTVLALLAGTELRARLARGIETALWLAFKAFKVGWATVGPKSVMAVELPQLVEPSPTHGRGAR